MNCLKNMILRSLAALNFVSFMIFMCLVDSESRIFLIICLFNITWLEVFFYVNSSYFMKGVRRDNKKEVRSNGSREAV